MLTSSSVPPGIFPKRLAIEYDILAGTCALLVFATFLLRLREKLGAPQANVDIFHQFNLGLENNLAAWFSGALLAITCLHATDGVALYKSSRRGVARAWKFIAGVLLFLSADEIGSLHERLAHLGSTIGTGRWSFLLPIGACLAALLIWAMLLLWRAGGVHRRHALVLMGGFVLLGSAAAQEFLEHALQWNNAWANAARLSIEEGSELLGMLILLRVAMTNTAGRLAERRTEGESVFAILLERRRTLVVWLVALAPALTALTIFFDDGRGRPSDWLASMAFLAAAAVVFGCWLQGDEEDPRWVLGALLLALSCVCVAIGPGGKVQIPLFVTTSRAILIVLLTVLAIATSALIDHTAPSPGRLTLLLGACLLLLILSEHRSLGLLLTAWTGTVVYREMALRREHPQTLGQVQCR